MTFDRPDWFPQQFGALLDGEAFEVHQGKRFTLPARESIEGTRDPTSESRVSETFQRGMMGPILSQSIP
jgi:hypothetical protein